MNNAQELTWFDLITKLTSMEKKKTILTMREKYYKFDSQVQLLYNPLTY